MHDLVSHSGSTVLVDPLLDGGSFGDLVLAMQPRQRCPCFIFLDHLFLEGHTVPFDYFSFHFPVLSFLLFAPLVQGTAQNNITDPTMQAVVGAVITVLIRSFAVQSLLLLFIGVIVLVVNHAQVQPAEQSQASRLRRRQPVRPKPGRMTRRRPVRPLDTWTGTGSKWVSDHRRPALARGFLG
jgi:hypothetical protein